VATEHCIDAVHGAGGDKLRCTPRRQLLGVLEEKPNLTRQLGAPRDEQAGDGEQDRRMPVVPAGVHHTLSLRGEVDTALLLNWKCVDVSSKRERRPRPSALQSGDNARRCGTVDLEAAKRRECLADEASGFVLTERELGMSMQVPPPSNRLARDLVHVHEPETNPGCRRRTEAGHAAAAFGSPPGLRGCLRSCGRPSFDCERS
jgi:hypothetical protein